MDDHFAVMNKKLKIYTRRGAGPGYRMTSDFNANDFRPEAPSEST
jgi:hypothetical protein